MLPAGEPGGSGGLGSAEAEGRGGCRSDLGGALRTSDTRVWSLLSHDARRIAERAHLAKKEVKTNAGASW